jgi:phytoene synthase
VRIASGRRSTRRSAGAATVGGAPVGGEPTLEESYERCRALNRAYGTTYYWSTFALPRIKRHHVHALYAFCRHADDIVDDLGTMPTDVRAKALGDFGDRFFTDLEAGSSSDVVLKAVVHTVRAFDIDPDCFRRFLRSMTMDLTVPSYDTWEELRVYMDGSAAVIGEMMLPILEPLAPEAKQHARDLGDAFQLTNFLRDVDEDLDRGRIYLPLEDVRRFGAEHAFAERRATTAFVDLMRFEIERCRELYASADLGVDLLPLQSARCVMAARALYSRILDRIEDQGHDVFSARARVPTWQKAAMVAQVAGPRPVSRAAAALARR